MNASNLVPSLIRTYVPLGVGALVSYLATRGMHIDAQTSAAVVVLLTSVITALYYTGVRLLEHRYPAIGTVLLGLGIKAKPGYVKPGAQSPPAPPVRP